METEEVKFPLYFLWGPLHLVAKKRTSSFPHCIEIKNLVWWEKQKRTSSLSLPRKALLKMWLWFVTTPCDFKVPKNPCMNQWQSSHGWLLPMVEEVCVDPWLCGQKGGWDERPAYLMISDYTDYVFYGAPSRLWAAVPGVLTLLWETKPFAPGCPSVLLLLEGTVPLWVISAFAPSPLNGNTTMTSRKRSTLTCRQELKTVLNRCIRSLRKQRI